MIPEKLSRDIIYECEWVVPLSRVFRKLFTLKMQKSPFRTEQTVVKWGLVFF